MNSSEDNLRTSIAELKKIFVLISGPMNSVFNSTNVSRTLLLDSTIILYCIGQKSEIIKNYSEISKF